MNKKLLTFLRRSMHTVAIVAVLGVTAFYLFIHFSLADMLLKYSLEKKLSEELGTKVTLDGEAEVDWLNQVVLNQLTIYDQHDDTLLYARRTLIAYELSPLLSHHLVLNTCQLIDFDIRIYKDSLNGDPNFQFIIDALSKDKDPDEQSFIQKFDFNAILLRQGNVSYNVTDQPLLEDFPIDPNHIEVSKLSANLHIHDNQLVVKKFHCDEHQSHLKVDRCDVALNLLKLRKEAVGQNLPLVTLKGFEIESETLLGKTDAQYSTDEITLNIEELNLPYGHPRLKGVKTLRASTQVHITQLQNPTDSLYVSADFREIESRLDTLGSVRLTGNAEGLLCHPILNLQLNSELGNADLSVDLICQGFINARAGLERVIIAKGHTRSNRFDLKKITPSEANLGSTALDTDFEVKYSPSAPLSVAIDGKVQHLDWKSHTFRDIVINGEMQGKWVKGSLILNDTLGAVDATLDVDLRHPEHRYKVDGQIAHLNPNALKLTDIAMLDSLTLNGKVHIDLIAQSVLDMQGVVKVNQFSIEKGEQTIELEPIDFEGTADRGALRSPIVNATYYRDRKSKGYHLEGRIPVINDLLAIVDLPLRLESVNDFNFDFYSNMQINQGHIEFPNIDLLQGRYAKLELSVKGDTTGLLFPNLTFEAGNLKHTVEGELAGQVNLQSKEIQLQPATLLYNKEHELQLTGAHFRQSESGDLVVENFNLRGENQQISASGILGNNGDKQFAVKLSNFELGNIFSNFEKGYLHFGGNATGEIVVNSTPQLHIIADSLKIQNFTYIDTLVGDATINLNYQIPDKHITVRADIETDKVYHTYAGGEIQLGQNDSLDLRFDTDHLPMGFINNWTGNILQQLTGRVTGNARLFGPMSKLQLTGDPRVDCKFTHKVIGAHFHLKDQVHLDPDLIWFKDAYVDDCHGHPLTLNAKVAHQNLKHFGYDVNLDLPNNSQGFLVLDREQAPGRIYWGQLYAQGQAHLQGGNGKHRFTIKVGTTDKSWFFLSPYSQDNSAEQAVYSFLTFRDKKQLIDPNNADNHHTSVADQSIQPTDGGTDLQVDLKVSATDQCKVTIQIDPLSDDLLTCRGNGDLSVFYDPTQDVRLAGIYQISEGTYTMSMKGDLFRKNFQLQKTSSVAFNGVPSQAELNLDCRYNIPSVNLNDLDENITSSASMSRSTVPVDCKLNVTGHLSAPRVGFDLELKNVSENVNTLVHNVIRDEQMLNQEVLYLLLFSKFYTPQYAQSSQNHTGSELTSFASSSITSQLNELLSKISNNFTMGTNFRTDKGDFSDLEMDVSLSTRLLGDRLLLNGNVGYRDPANRVGAMNNTTSFIGDFDLEFLLNPSGTMRVKAYSHYNERDYSINNALTTQGIGFIFRKDFRNYLDWWPWNRKQETDSLLIKVEEKH